MSEGSEGLSASLSPPAPRPLYTPEERVRRDNSKWTLVQGLLAPVQFLIFGVSLYLVIDYLNTGSNYDWAAWSVVVKTAALYTIMITGAIWEKVVFGQYLFSILMLSVGLGLAVLFAVGLFPEGILLGAVLFGVFAWLVYRATENDYLLVELDGDILRARFCMGRDGPAAGAGG